MKCPNCKKQIPENSKFCRYCGKGQIIEQNAIDYLIEENSHKQHTYAGFLIRAGAYIVDLLGLVATSFVIGVIFYILLEESIADNLLEIIPDAIFGYILYVIYNTTTLTIWSTTFGKYLFGLKVLSKKHQELSFRQALSRSLLQPLSTLFFLIGYWNMNKNSYRQTWHDKNAGTLVTKTEKNLIPAYIFLVIGIIVWVALIIWQEMEKYY